MRLPQFPGREAMSSGQRLTSPAIWTVGVTWPPAACAPGCLLRVGPPLSQKGMLAMYMRRRITAVASERA